MGQSGTGVQSLGQAQHQFFWKLPVAFYKKAGMDPFTLLLTQELPCKGVANTYAVYVTYVSQISFPECTKCALLPSVVAREIDPDPLSALNLALGSWKSQSNKNLLE